MKDGENFKNLYIPLPEVLDKDGEAIEDVEYYAESAPSDTTDKKYVVLTANGGATFIIVVFFVIRSCFNFGCFCCGCHKVASIIIRKLNCVISSTKAWVCKVFTFNVETFVR